MQYLDLALQTRSATDSNSSASGASCQLALLGKDGIWLMQVGRQAHVHV